MRQIIYLLLFIFLIFSCQNEKKEIVQLENLKISIKEKLKRSLSDEYFTELGIEDSAKEVLRAYYKKNGYSPVWINDSTLTIKGAEVKKLLFNKHQFGIPDSRYLHFKWKNASYLKDELLITATLAYIGKDLKEGFIDKENFKMKPLEPVSLDELQKITQFENYSISIAHQLIQLGPLDTNYQKIAMGLFDYCSNYPIDTSRFEIKSYRNDSLNAEINTRKALLLKGYLSIENADSLTFDTALKLFQLHNGLKVDGKIGTYTAIALNESTKHKLLRTALTLEKWRWKNKYPSKFVRINLPEYLLRFYSEDTLRSTNRIIIGKTETSSPELTSKIRQLVVFPYWTVPQSIANKEILEKAKVDPDYFERNHFKLFKNDLEINPASVNWAKYSTFPYKLRQEFGPTNSLGILKFEFHNRFGVYIHDTPNRELFKKDVRSFSHGCMRCENPIELAKLFLEKDSIRHKRNKYNSISLDSLFLLENNYYISLVDPIPLFVEYKTVVVINSILTFFPDIYGRDEKYIGLMVEN